MNKRGYFLSFIFLIYSVCHLIAQADRIDIFDEPDLFKYFNPKQKDFIKEFDGYLLKKTPDSAVALRRLKHYNCSTIWINDYSQDGIVGLDYWRIQIKIMTVTRDKNNPLLFNAVGKSKYKDTIVKFKGSIKILNAIESANELDSDHILNGSMKAAYDFEQDGTYYNNGRFRGIVESDYLIDSIHKILVTDTTWAVADSYYNNTFVGIWLRNKAKDTIKCIWGDGRLPYCFDFDGGSGELYPQVPYQKNGWETYMKNGYDKEATAIENEKW